MAAAAQVPGIAYAFTLFNTATPKIYADIDRVKAEMLGLHAGRISDTLEVYLGSAFVHDFNFLGRTFRVTAQADGAFRSDPREFPTPRPHATSAPLTPPGRAHPFPPATWPHPDPPHLTYPPPS